MAAQFSGANVTLALPADVNKTPEFNGHLAAIADNVRQVTIDGRGRFGVLSWLCSQIRSGAYSDVLIPYADGGLAECVALFEALSLRRSSIRARVSVLKMRGTFAYEQSGVRRRLQNLITLRALSSNVIHRVYWIDAIAYEFVKKHCDVLARKSVFLPDPVPQGQMLSCLDAVNALKLPTGFSYIGLFGAIDERKGADRLIDAFNAAGLSAQWKLLLAGKFSATIRNRIHGQTADSNRIVALDKFIDNSELPTYFEACDFVCVPFRRHIGSSSTVIRAAAANRPVLGDSYGWIGEMTKRYQLGSVCDSGDEHELATAIDESSKEAKTWAPSPLHQQFVDLHSEPNFLQVLSKDIGDAPAG
jgi:glycosyltransferase involved in cell wall biosynthesis